MKVRFSPPKLQRNVTLLVIRALIPIGFVTSVTGKAENLQGGGGEGRVGTINLTSTIRRRWKCCHGVLSVSGECWVVNIEASLCQNLFEWEKKTRADGLVSGFQIVESGTFHYLNAWCRIGVDEPIRWLSKRNSSTKTEPQSPNQSSVHWSVPSLKLFVCLKCVTRL